MPFDALPRSSARLPTPPTPLLSPTQSPRNPCIHEFAYHCSVCWTAGFTCADHDHDRHIRFMCKHCGIIFDNIPVDQLQPLLTFCQNCSTIKELNSSNAHLPFLCFRDHSSCDECLDLYLPNEEALINKSLYTSLDETFKEVFNTSDWALVCPLCNEQGELPGDLEEWFERQSRPETFTSFEELGKACRIIVGRREEIGLWCEEEGIVEEEENS